MKPFFAAIMAGAVALATPVSVQADHPLYDTSFDVKMYVEDLVAPINGDFIASKMAPKLPDALNGWQCGRFPMEHPGNGSMKMVGVFCHGPNGFFVKSYATCQANQISHDTQRITIGNNDAFSGETLVTLSVTCDTRLVHP